MFNRFRNFSDQKKAAEDAAIVEMLNRTQAMISFMPDGTIVDANSAFLDLLGYTLEAVEGKHHRIFCSAEYTKSTEYSDFWKKLASGEAHSGEFERFCKNGASVWIYATYAAVRDASGKIYKVVKCAQDITPQKYAMAQFQTALEKLGSGQPGVRVALSDGNSLYEIAMNFNHAMEKIFGDLVGLKDQAEQVATDSLSRAERNRATLERSNAQEQRIGEISELASEVSETMKRTQKTVSNAVERLDPVMAVLEDGQHLIEAARGTTQSLEVKAKSMSDINRMIDDLSFQTNLLALNAGVEAARAGEAGAGFSVVASEIRSLAQQSSSASAQINDLIRETTQTSSRAAEDVGKGSEAFLKIQEQLGELQTAFMPVIGDMQEQFDRFQRVDKGTASSLSSVVDDRKAAHRNLQAIEEQITILNSFSDGLGKIASYFSEQ